MIQQGHITNAWYETPNGNVAMAQSDRARTVLTVDAVYDYVVEGYRKRYAKIDVSYDPVLHYPKRVYVDRLANAVDDEAEFSISVVNSNGGA
jgi:hypothetical protein